MAKISADARFSGEVSRGIHVASINEHFDFYNKALAEGANVRFRAFTSTSTSSGFSGNIKFRINAQTGVKIHPVSLYPNESEVLFPARTEFKISKVKKKNGLPTVHMTEAPSSDTSYEKLAEAPAPEPQPKMSARDRAHMQAKMQSGDIFPELVKPEKANR